MRRTPLVRRTPLKRVAFKRRLRSLPREVNLARAAWGQPESGFCQCGCGRVGWRLHRHHVLLRQIVHREGADEWSFRNSMLLHEDCHAAHHSGARKIRLEQVPEAAIAFAVDVLGEDRATDYFRRRYAGVNHEPH